MGSSGAPCLGLTGFMAKVCFLFVFFFFGGGEGFGRGFGGLGFPGCGGVVLSRLSACRFDEVNVHKQTTDYIRPAKLGGRCVFSLLSG